VIKKAVILTLALLYINVSWGIGVQFHYCMGEMVSMAFGHHADHEDTCGDCGMASNESSCCKDESLLLKVNDNHQPSSFHFHSQKNFSAGSYDFPCCYPVVQKATGLLPSIPPDTYSGWQTNKRYVSLRVFRI
jgi:hypothetical protein